MFFLVKFLVPNLKKHQIISNFTSIDVLMFDRALALRILSSVSDPIDLRKKSTVFIGSCPEFVFFSNFRS